MPTIATAWQGVAEAESRRAGDSALECYVASFDDADGVPAEEGELEAAHRGALAAAQRVFDEIAIGDAEVRRANEERWHRECAARWVQVAGAGAGALGAGAGQGWWERWTAVQQMCSC